MDMLRQHPNHRVSLNCGTIFFYVSNKACNVNTYKDWLVTTIFIFRVVFFIDIESWFHC